MNEIKNLVFEGGGVLGMAYIGGIMELEKRELLGDVKRVAGTSAGALMAMLVSLKYDTQKIKKIIESTDFKKFEDRFNPFRIVTKFGLYRGDFLLKFIQQLIKDITGSENTTFEELHEKGYLDLKVFACDLNTVDSQEFSFDVTPKVIVAHAVRASMSIPLFFSAWKFPNNIPNNHVFVDGGTIYNYPITAFETLENTLGFFFQSHTEISEKTLNYKQPFAYIESLFKAILQAQKVDFLKDEEQVAATIFIDTMGVSPTEFKLSDQQKQALFNSGIHATAQYFDGK